MKQFSKPLLLLCAVLFIVLLIGGTQYIRSIASKQLSVARYSHFEGKVQPTLSKGDIGYMMWELSVSSRVTVTSVSPTDYSGFVIEDIFYVRWPARPHFNFTPLGKLDVEQLSILQCGRDIQGLVLEKLEDPRERHSIVLKLRIVDPNVMKGPMSTRVEYKWNGISVQHVFPRLN